MKIRYNREIISGAIFVVLSAVLWFLIPVQVQTLEKTPINAQTFPRIAIGGMFLCSVGLLLEGIFVREKQELYVTKESFRSNAFKKEMRSVMFALLLIAYCFLIGHLGYIFCCSKVSDGSLFCFFIFPCPDRKGEYLWNNF